MLFRYPYTDSDKINLDWILAKIKEVTDTLDEYVALNKLTWKGAWNIGDAYPIWSIVDDNGDGYVSIKPVPRNVEITNTEYWQMVANYSGLYSAFEQRIENLEKSTQSLNYISKNARDILNTVLLNKSTPKIKVIGDSVGLGADATGFGEDPNGVITWEVVGDVHREGFKSVPCWVNYFRKACLNINQNTNFVNMSINGMSATEMNPRKTNYKLGNDNDIIFVVVGINDCNMASSLSDFKNNYKELVEYFATKSENVILVTPTICAFEKLGTPNVQLSQICSVIRALSVELNMPFIDLNKALYSKRDNLSASFFMYYNDFVQGDRTHPSNIGHSIVWCTFSEIIGLGYVNDSIEDSIPYLNANAELLNGITNINFNGEDPSNFSSVDGVTINLHLNIAFNGFTNGVICNIPDGMSPLKPFYANLHYKDDSSNNYYTIPILISNLGRIETVGGMIGTPGWGYANIEYLTRQYVRTYPTI